MLGPVEIVDEIDSTNRALTERARAGAPAGVVLVADHQTAGRGRLDRRWEATPGSSLLVSVLLRPTLGPDRAHLASIAAGLAAVAACEAAAGVEVGLKWPNDVVADVDGASLKLAGILSEALFEHGALDAIVVGMGLNLTDGPHLPDTATSLARLAGRPIARSAVLQAWLAHLDQLVADLEDPALLTAYRRRCTTLGRRVRVETRAGTQEGTAVELTADGHLVLDTPTGRLMLAEGDVTHLRSLPTLDGGTSSFDA